MATLTKKKDGGYIIRSFAGRFTTLQVKAEGVAFLKDLGIDENDEVPRPLIKQLLRMGLAFTTNVVIPGELEPSAPELTTPIENGLQMAIEENEDGWSLSILFPELPLEWVRDLYSGSDAATMQACDFHLNGSDKNILPAMRLWPGKGGAACLVRPQTKPYTVEPFGPWPPSWDLHDWIQDIRGLEPTGSLFKGEGEGGVRLRAGNSIISGTSYYFVFNANTSPYLIKKQILPIPSPVQPRLLGRLEEWEAWAVQIPDDVDDITREWCNQIGYPLEKPLWRLQVVSPPPLRYSSSGLPIFEVGVEAIIAVFPPPPLEGPTPTELVIECNTTQVAYLPIYTKSNLLEKSHPFEDDIKRGFPIYFALPLHSLGTYRLRSLLGRVIPLTFTTIPPADFEVGLAALTEQPSPLKIYVRNNKSNICIRAFDSGHIKTDLPHIDEESLPTIEVDCPSPIDVQWSYGEIHGRRQALASRDVTSYLSDPLALASTNKCMFILHLDAGNFGFLHLRFLPLAEPVSDISLDVTAISQRVRWLSVAVPALVRQGTSTISIPGVIQQSLAQLENLLHGASLARITQVPVSLLPHLTMLARLLDSHTYNLTSGLKSRTTFQKLQKSDIAHQGVKYQEHMQSKEISHE